MFKLPGWQDIFLFQWEDYKSILSGHLSSMLMGDVYVVFDGGVGGKRAANMKVAFQWSPSESKRAANVLRFVK